MKLHILVLLPFLNVIAGYNILVLAPFPGPSHWLMFQRYIKELSQRGHTVTAITGIKMNAPVANYTEVYIDPPYDLQKIFNHELIFETNFLSFQRKLMALMELGLATSDHALQTNNVQHFIKADKSHFDVILAEQFFQESFLMFAHKYGAPIVTLNTYGCSDFMDRAMGLLTPTSFVPHSLFDFTDDMSFPERFINTFVVLADMAVRHFYYMPAMEVMAQKQFSIIEAEKGPLPLVNDLETSISVMLINSHKALSKPRPFMPGMIDIGGSHIKPISPLPKDLQDYLDSATDGVIYFSIGAYMKSAAMPIQKVQIFLDVFSKLKQKVLWKWEDDATQPKLPKNVRMQKWMPQSDILAHKNVVLFISHGGMFGTFEGTSRGVPFLFLPLYGDQYRNAKKAVRAGTAEYLLLQQLTQGQLEQKLDQLLHDKSYRHNAHQLSSIFNDNLVQPIDEAMYWIEYAARHKGAPHLQSAAVKLNAFRYMLLDVVFVVVAAFVMVAIVLKKLFCMLLGLCGKSNKKTSDKKSKKKQK